VCVFYPLAIIIIPLIRSDKGLKIRPNGSTYSSTYFILEIHRFLYRCLVRCLTVDVVLWSQPAYEWFFPGTYLNGEVSTPVSQVVLALPM